MTRITDEAVEALAETFVRSASKGLWEQYTAATKRLLIDNAAPTARAALLAALPHLEGATPVAAAQVMWEALRILGFDLDGDPTPAARLTQGFDVFAEQFLSDMRQMRADYDEALDEGTTPASFPNRYGESVTVDLDEVEPEGATPAIDRMDIEDAIRDEFMRFGAPEISDDARRAADAVWALIGRAS